MPTKQEQNDAYQGGGAGGGAEGDLVAEGLERADVVALLAAVADAGVVEVRAEVVVAG